MAKLKGKPLLAEAWTKAAALYFSEVVPRFKPWTLDAIQPLVTRAPLPQGQVLVLCCGPGHELLLLDEQLKGAHPITGIDLSPGMIEVANQLILAHSHGASSLSAAHAQTEDAGQIHSQTWQDADTASLSQHGTSHASAGPASWQQQQQQPRLQAVVGDATVIPEACLPAAAVLSVFGLQQMTAEANTAVSTWVSALSPGGVASIIYWPPSKEQNSPWARFTQVAEEHTNASKASASPPPATTSSAELTQEPQNPVTLTPITPSPSHTTAQQHAARAPSDAACDGTTASAANANSAAAAAAAPSSSTPRAAVASHSPASLPRLETTTTNTPCSPPTAAVTTCSSSSSSLPQSTTTNTPCTSPTAAVVASCPSPSPSLPPPPPPPLPATAIAAEVPPWDAFLKSSALAVAGVRLCEDRLIRHPFEWPSLAHFWEVMTHGGPWCARRIAFGDAHMDELFVRFAALYAEEDGVADEGAPLLLAPEARLLVFTKDEVQPCFCLEREHSRL